jgi:hypothetical protein
MNSSIENVCEVAIGDVTQICLKIQIIILRRCLEIRTKVFKTPQNTKPVILGIKAI